MAVKKGTEIWLKTIAILGLLFAAITLYTTLLAPETSSDAKEYRRRSANRPLLRFARAVQDDCLWVLVAKGTGGTLTSPSYPENYPSNADCHWLITAADPNATISLKIDSLSIEPDNSCRLDFLQVYLGPTLQAPALGPFCGNIYNRVIETNSSKILLEFHSDMAYEDKGFSIDYFTQKTAECQELMTDGSGTLRSPGFPDIYPDNTDCSTLITVKEDKKIILIFDSIDMEYGDNCTFDYVQIFDGKTKNSTLLGQICQQLDSSYFESSSNSLLVHFHSDDSVNKKGYRARYSSLDKRSFPTGDCLLETGENNGSISSPNYPENYNSFSNCSIWILAPEGSTVFITIDALLLELDYNCSYDFLEITEGPSLDSKLLGRFCGKRSEPKRITSTQHEVRIIFQSDDFVEFSGFKLHYHYIKNEPEVTEKPEDEDPDFDGTLTFSVTPQNATLSERASYMLRCDTRHPNARIRWLKGDVFLAGDSPMPGLKALSNNTLWIQKMNRRLVGLYTCIAISPEDEITTTASIQLEDDDVSCPVEYRKIPANSEFEEGEFAHLECLAADDQTILSWEKDGKPLPMENHITVLENGYIFMESISIEDAGVYTCVARDAVTDCVKRASAALKVNERVKIEDICGKPKFGQSRKKKAQSEHAKIVGGHNAQKGAYPWQVMLWDPMVKSFCGGALLNERWIVTAAHCLVSDIPWDTIKIKLGKHDRTGWEEEEFETFIADKSAIVVHPSYKKFTFDNDLALVRLRHHVHFTDHILPVCLGDRNTQDFLLNGGEGIRSKTEMGTVIGFGRLKENGPLPKYLQEIKIPLVDQDDCKSSTNFTVTQNMFCAGYSQETIGDACRGDSGGPFLMSHEGRSYMVGLVSWGEGCGKQNKYGFYTRIGNYLPWIQGIIKS